MSSTPLDAEALADTRRSMHAVAEHILAGPQYRLAGTIRLSVTRDGFATIALTGDPSRLEVQPATLVASRPSGFVEVPLAGAIAELAEAVGVEPGAPAGVYRGGSGVDASFVVSVDEAPALQIMTALTKGDAALRQFGDRHQPQDPPTPVLWPEHFDVGIALGGVNYGVSPGDEAIAEPYAYVGPWHPRTGTFWNEPFGAARPASEFDDVEALVGFFEEGRSATASDPIASASEPSSTPPPSS